MNIKDRVLLTLKTKASSFGFSKSELEVVADNIVANNSLTDDTNETDVNAIVEAVLPVLKVGQQYASRLADEARKRNDPTQQQGGEGSGSRNDSSPKTEDAEPAWFKAYRESQEQRIAKLEGEKVQETRMAKLREVTKDGGKIGESIMKNATRITFKDDADFDAYLTEAQSDIEAYRQSVGNDKLSTLGGKPRTGNGTTEDLATDDEIANAFGS